MLCLRATTMQTLSALLLFVGVASTVALPSHGRQRRGAPNGAGAGAGATAGSFATSGAYGNGYGGAGGFAFPGPTAYGPSAFESAFRSYFDQMESLLAAQHAHAQALSNRYWSDWRPPVPRHPVAAFPGAGAGVGAGVGVGMGGAFAPHNYYNYYSSGVPQSSHSHTAVSFLPHR